MEENRLMILAGEIGATRTRLAAFDTEGNKLQLVVEKTYMSQEHGGLAEIITGFIKTEGIPVHSACFGVAGPVTAGRSKISNLPWTIDRRELASQLKLDSVGLINDLEAYAYGIDALESKDFITLSEGAEDAEGNRAVISARTGLGVAGLYWDGFRHHPFACEGGHADFAPRNKLDMELLTYLQGKHGRVSCERILSGPGIKNIYDFLRDTKKSDEPKELREQMSQAPDPPALISKLAAEGKTPICDQTMSLFVTIYGAETGNCALHFMSTGGIFIGGSIAAKNINKMKDPAFMKSFLDKGRMTPLLKQMPVKIVLNDDSGIIGAARYTLVQKAFRTATRAV
ncbi:MAG: glucokinase [Acidobacteriales bacterium 13_2_20CM_55_8]|jgi:glucokinase|nr:MAG: glucokinase [Acidobacteriales bacterium 13_2_20CM_55_8]